MAIANDVTTVADAYAAVGAQTVSHAASASARAAVVLIDQNGSTTNQISGVTYGGVAMNLVTSANETTEPGYVKIYWLDGITGGTQNVVMTSTGTANKQMVISTMTVSAGMQVALAGYNYAYAINSYMSWRMDGIAAGSVMEAYEVVHSGLDTMTSTPGAAWTSISYTDLGLQGRAFATQHYSSTPSLAQGGIVCGWNSYATDDFVGASIGFIEQESLIVSAYEPSQSSYAVIASWTDGTSPATVALPSQVAAGDLIIVSAITQDNGVKCNTPTATGLTFSLVNKAETQYACNVYIWSAVAPSATTVSVTITLSATFSGAQWGFNVSSFHNSSGVGASSVLPGTRLMSAGLGIQTERDNSAVVVAIGDYIGADVVYNDRHINGNAVGAAVQAAVCSAGVYSVYSLKYTDAGRRGLKTVGLLAPYNEQPAMVAVEILGPSTQVTKTVTSSWKVYGAVTKTATAAWKVSGRVTKTATATWNISGWVDKFVTAAWNVRATIAPDTSSHPVASGWGRFESTGQSDGTGYTTSTDPSITAISTAPDGRIQIGALSTTGTTGEAVFLQFGPSDADYDIPEVRALLLSAFAWLNPVSPIDTWETQVGEFMIDSIEESNFPHTLQITGRDYTKKCLLSKFTQATQFTAGQTLEALVGAIAGSAGITKRILPVTGVTVGKAFFYERGVSRWEAIKEITDSYYHEVFFDATGYLVIRPYNDPTLTPPTFYVKTGPDGGVVATYKKRTTDTRIYNHIIVTGESSDSSIPPVWAEAKNEVVGSPTSIDELGDRLFEYSSSFITTTAQAQAVADSFIKIHALEEFELSFDTLLLPWLEAGDIIGWVDPKPNPGDPTSFLLSSITIPLSLAPMSSVGKRVTNVGGI